MARASTHNTNPVHYIVDGSNIATEGRAMPSLKQLNDAVLAFIEEHPDALITVVVDATFGHRIDKKEVKAFDEAVANNELVTPPAGAVGRGDAFVLSIANKAKAGILSNDSFQEFHGDYNWLFDEGRLIGGKPVPHVGWVFVERLPVRGPKSRQSVKDAKQVAKPSDGERRSRTRGSGSPLADQPMPVPTAPPPGPLAVPKSKRAASDVDGVVAATKVASSAAAPAARTAVNELLPFLDFVERHPVGTGCTVVVESYASHGAYARAGDVLVYLPLRLMGDPMPRSARAAVTIGEAIAVVIVGYVPERRSIDAALLSASEVAARTTPAPTEAVEPTPTRRRRTAAKDVADTTAVEVAVEPTDTAQAAAAEPESKPRRARTAKKVAAPAPEVAPAATSATDDTPPRRTRRPAKQAEVADTAEPTPPVKTPAKRTRKQSPKPADKAPDTTQEPATVAKPAAKKRSPAKSPPTPAPQGAAKAPAKRPRAAQAAPKKGFAS